MLLLLHNPFREEGHWLCHGSHWDPSSSKLTLIAGQNRVFLTTRIDKPTSRVHDATPEKD